MLEIEYKSKKLAAICTNYTSAKREYGERMAIIIHQRIDELRSANSINMLIQFSIGRCHKLQGNRKNEYAMDLIHPYRLIFEHKNNDIQLVKIVNIEDYH